ncbi:MAG: glycosyl transferase, partial [Pseudomonadota bacterium]
MLRALFRFVFGIVWWIGFRVALLVALVVGTSTAYYYATLPPVEALLDGRDRGSVTLKDRDNQVFAWRGEQYQITRTETASPHLVNAVVATEDKRFFRHFGRSRADRAR